MSTLSIKETMADFYIYKSGSGYVAKRQSTGLSYRNTSLSTIINTTIPALKSGAVIEFAAAPLTSPFTADATLQITSSRQVLRGQGPMITVIKLADGVNDSLLEEEGGHYYQDVYIQDMTLDHNGANQTAGAALEWNIADACTVVTTYDAMLHLYNLHLRGGKDYSLYFKTATGSNAVCRFFYVKASGQVMYLERFFDSQFVGGEPGSIHLLNGSASNFFSDLYHGGGLAYNLWMSGGSSDYGNVLNNFMNCRFDHTTHDSALLEGYSRYNNFCGCTFSNKLQAAAGSPETTGSPIDIAANCTHNVFSGSWIGGGTSAAGGIAMTDHQWAHPIDDAGGQNYFSGVIMGARGAAPAPYVAAKVLGAGSVFDGYDEAA